MAGSEESQAVSSGSRSDESAGGPFALRARRPGAPTPVPVYLVSPVEVRKLFGKGAATIDTEQSRGTPERSDAKASKGKKAKSNRRSGSKPAPASESDAGTAGKASKTKKRSGSSGRHRRKKEAGSSKEAGSASNSDGTEAIWEGIFKFGDCKVKITILLFSATISKAGAGKARSKKSGGGSKGRKEKKGEFL